MKSNLPTAYSKVLNDLKEKIRKAKLKIAFTVNADLLYLYWEIGDIILNQQKQEGWGTKVISRLAKDLKNEFPDMQGLSERNLVYMQTFASTYPLFTQAALAEIPQKPITQAALAKLPKSAKGKKKKTPILQAGLAKLPSQIVQTPLAQITWYHHITLLDKVKNPEERLFYIYKTIENGWSRNVMVHQIESHLYKRQGKAITNFHLTLPSPQSDLAKETIKSPYILDFLNLSEDVQERELERAIITHLKKFLLELGKGFTYAGNQYNLRIEDDEYFLDLLFFNYKLNCFVVFELKVGEFKSEYIGKLNLYINTVDAQIKEQAHQPTIGILLCKTPNKTVVEYSLRGLVTPLGVADYKLSKALPENLKSDLPTVKELEEELEREVEEFQKPVEKKLARLKELIGGLKQPKVKEKRNPKTSARIFNKVVLPLRDAVKKSLAKIAKEFESAEIMIWTDGQGHKTDAQAQAHLKKFKEFNEYRIEIRLNGFKPVGTKAFYINKEISIVTQPYFYSIGFGRMQHDLIIPEKLYHELPDKQEFEGVIDTCVEKIADEIAANIERIQKEKK
ncbi:MAG: PDDEXK nuclease domain-containing protein [Bacteroidota bacterium]